MLAAIKMPGLQRGLVQTPDITTVTRQPQHLDKAVSIAFSQRPQINAVKSPQHQLRQSTRAAALPTIGADTIAQSVAVGHAVKTLAFCGFSMIGINASTKFLAERTGNQMINTIATSIAALLIGATVRNELSDMQDAFKAAEYIKNNNPLQSLRLNEKLSSAQTLETKHFPLDM